MLITCPECNHNVSDKAISCPNCGYPINSSFNTGKPLDGQSEKSQPVSKEPRKKKKHKKLPNGFGSIKYLGKGRSNPYAAYPPTREYTDLGIPVTMPAIGYFVDWYQAFDALREYNHNPYDLANKDITFGELFALYYKDKYECGKKEYSKAAKTSSKAAFNNCRSLHNRKMSELRKADLQKVVDECPLKYASLELIVALYHGIYKYALSNDILDKDYSRFVTINIPDDDENGEPFTQDDINLLWQNIDMPGVDTILILIYSGFRISAFQNMQYDFVGRTFHGGVKTKAGKNRTVPIHDAIFDLVSVYNGRCFYKNPSVYRTKVFYPVLQSLGIDKAADGQKHTPHDCRHTFSWLCDKYNVDDVSKHLLMGHKLSGDVENTVYAHRTIDDLRKEISKIKV